MARLENLAKQNTELMAQQPRLESIFHAKWLQQPLALPENHVRST